MSGTPDGECRSLAVLHSRIDYFGIDNFFCPLSDIVHTPYPFHLAIRLKLLGDVFLLYHMFYKLRKHFFCLLVDFSKVGVQLAAKKQGCIYGIAVFTEIPTPFLAPNANRSGLW